jgi:shikimate kinase / 3-dehydroquinate synthase
MSRPLLLSGFMATGKSAVGRVVAKKRGATFVDLDQAIERRVGKSVAEIFDTEGEAGFRRYEREALGHELARPGDAPKVIALGGGALLHRQQRVDILGQAVVVTLRASADEILRRVESQEARGSRRPLLAGPDRRGRVESLLATRNECYAEAHGSVETDGRELSAIADDVLRYWEEDAVCLAAGEQSYRVAIGSDLIEARLADLVGQPSGTLLVTDENVSPLHGDKARRVLRGIVSAHGEVVLTPGEEHKNLEGLAQIYHAAFSAGIDRKATFVGLGGGVVTDMTGFAAATWVRGVRWVGLPTTLLSMVDASVGGKTAVDFQTAKNAVGAFWQPSGVICDVVTLLTETPRMYVGALSEVVKTALIGDPELFALLEDNVDAILRRDLATMKQVVERCVRVKARVVALDERETGIRATLNLGHTLGHALEASSGYTGLTHGEAVSLGLVAALRLGEKKNQTPPQLTQRVLELLGRLGLPKELDRGALQSSAGLLGHDKKRAGNSIRFVYARDVGDVVTDSILVDELMVAAPTLADS